MKIYVVGSSKNTFSAINSIRTKFLIDEKHDGDNIDFLNPWYCELTGLYYLWKHCDDEIIGLEHYRRYFINKNGKALSEDEILELLKHNDIICHYKRKYTNYKTIKDELIAVTKDRETIEKFEDFIKKHDPSFDILAAPYKHSFNMAIGRKQVLNKLYEQLFAILNEFIVNFDIRKMKHRTIGYISEFYFSHLLSMQDTVYVDVFNAKFNKLA